MIRALGRALQFIGLLLPLVAIILQLPVVITLWQMLIMAVAGVIAFCLGRLIEGYAAK